MLDGWGQNYDSDLGLIGIARTYWAQGFGSK